MNFMNYQFTSTQLIVGGIVLLIVVVIAVAAYMEHRKKRTLALRTRFGSEYDRAVLTHGPSGAAESKLADRATRVETLRLRDLGAVEHEGFVTDWRTVQSHFV